MTSDAGHSLALRERLALCETALAVGPDAATLCEGWQARDLVRHLAVRERPWLRVRPPADQSFEAYVELVRTPPRLLRTVGALDRALNTVEYFVHHEDLLRQRPGWEVRDLGPAAERELWRSLKLLGRVLVRPAGVPVTITDGPASATLRAGEWPVTIEGPVSEIALYLFGRRKVRGLTFGGPANRVAALRRARLGF